VNGKQRQDSKMEFLIAQKFDGKAFKNASFLLTFLVQCLLVKNHLVETE
jgi:hypothetical protein